MFLLESGSALRAESGAALLLESDGPPPDPGFYPDWQRAAPRPDPSAPAWWAASAAPARGPATP